MWLASLALASVLLVSCGIDDATAPPATQEPTAAAAPGGAEPRTGGGPSLTPAPVETSAETPNEADPAPAPTEPPPEFTAPAIAGPLEPAASADPPARRSYIVPPNVSADAALVMDEASGAILFEDNAHNPLRIASLTKIATAVVAIEQGDLEREVEVGVDFREMPESSVMGLVPGDTFTLRDLLFGVMLASGNEAAIAVGEAISGSESAFVGEMNALMQRLGLEVSSYRNTHGLDEKGHMASAHDLAVLSRYAMSLDEFLPLAMEDEWTANGSREIRLVNRNPLVHDYDGADGVKVGFTDDAGRTIVGSASRDGHRVYVVLLNSRDSAGDAAQLLDWAFVSHAWPE